MARRGKSGMYGGLYGGDARRLYSNSGHRNMMIYGKPPRRWPKILAVIIVVLIIALCVVQFACGCLPFLSHDDAQEDASSLVSTAQQTALEAADNAEALNTQLNGTTSKGTFQAGLDTTILISVVGDCTLGSDPDYSGSGIFEEYYEANGPAYFFENVTRYTANDQLTICNFEGALTESTDIQEKSFNFKGLAEYAQVLTNGSVEAANLANNHSFDYGWSGYEDTKTNLTEAGITNFGYDRTATYTVQGIKIGLLGIYQQSTLEEDAATMQADVTQLMEEGCALIIGVFHWGVEGEYSPVSYQTEMAHAAIDAGCDVVLGGHPHVLQGVELYQNRYICYSLGNFCFGGNTNPMDYNTMIYQQTFTFKNGQLVIDEGTLEDVAVVPCSVSSASGYNDYQPTPLTGDAATSLIESLNSYSNLLEGTSVHFDTALDEDGRAQVT